MSQAGFERQVASIAADLAGRELDSDLQDYLNNRYPPDDPAFAALAELCRQGIKDGWLCDREHGGIRFGRVVQADPDSHGFSVDVVLMDDIVGPYHRHPNGEIDMVIPETEGARFDGHGAGWVVYGPDSAHHPTVEGGRAIVLYLLPGGAIEFTGQ